MKTSSCAELLEHDWKVAPSEAIQLQQELRSQVRIEPYRGPLRYIAGADISFNRFSPVFHAGFVVLAADTLEVVDRASAVMEVKFPYIPGLLSFREIPPLLEAWQGLHIKPDVIVFDGNGIAHPRRFGVASHAGVILDWPTVGCAKSLLVGEYEHLGLDAGSVAPLVDRKTQEELGLAYRTKDRVKPIFVSPGHRMDIESAFRILSMTVRGYRIPEPTRQAHLYVNELRKGH